MTIKSEMNDQYDPKSQPDPFTKPRTIPSKWDVSAFQSQITTSQNDELEQQSEEPDPVETAGDEQPTAEWEPDPFPKPRTIPGNWDTSSLV